MRPSVFIGSSIWRTVEPLHMRSLVPLLRDNYYGYYPQVGDALIERARGISATYFLRHTKGDVHLSLDSDIVEFTKESIDQMCEQAVEYGIVGACYITRSTMRTFPTSQLENGIKVLFANDPTPVPIQWAATGCLAVHRRVFEAMAETMPLLHEPDNERAFYPFYQTMIYDDPASGKILLSEDYAFCQRAKDLGFQTYLNPAVRVGHMGQFMHRMEDLVQEILEPQPIAITRNGQQWHIECAGTRMSAEEQGREVGPKPSRAERRREQRNGKPVRDLIGAEKGQPSA